MSMTPPEFWVARACFTLAAFLLLARVAFWVVSMEVGRTERLFLTFLIFGSVGIGWTEAWRWVGMREAMQRPRYSSEQVVQVSSEPGNYNETLKLDSAATLEHFGEASLDTIEMVLPASPPLAVDNPESGRDYQVGGSGTARLSVPPAASVRSLKTTDVAGSFVFHRVNARATAIVVEGRKFQVVLMSIRDKSTGNHKLLEYTFSISEQ